MREEDTTEAIYTFISQYDEQYGYPPTLREIGEECYISRGSLMRHLDRLIAWGWIEREPGRARSLRLVRWRKDDDPQPPTA